MRDIAHVRPCPCETLLMSDLAHARHCSCATLPMQDIAHVRPCPCETLLISDLAHARHCSCATLPMRDIAHVRPWPCETLLMCDLDHARHCLCATLLMCMKLPNDLSNSLYRPLEECANARWSSLAPVNGSILRALECYTKWSVIRRLIPQGFGVLPRCKDNNQTGLCDLLNKNDFDNVTLWRMLVFPCTVFHLSNISRLLNLFKHIILETVN